MLHHHAVKMYANEITLIVRSKSRTMQKLVLIFFFIFLLGKVNQASSVSSLNLNSISKDAWNHPPCQVGPDSGSCVFSLACAHSSGKHLGICRDGFYIKSCCQLVRHHAQTKFASAEDNIIENELDSQDLECGRRSAISNLPRRGSSTRRRSRIIGGRPAVFGAWPWQVNLRLNYSTSSPKHRCGAVLLNSHWIATAAHCVDGYDPHELVLTLGDHNKEKSDEPLPTVDRQAAEIVIHPDYNELTYESDLALLYILEDIPFSIQIRPVCLPEPGDGKVVGSLAFATGWGTVYEGGPKPNILQEVALPILDHEQCNKVFEAAGLNETLSDVFICAGYQEGGKDACEGDSGGPLVIQSERDHRWILAGLISWGRGCGEKNQPGVYTNITKFREWIESYISKS